MTEQHRKKGRPATGQLPKITLALPSSILRAIYKSAADHFESRNDAARRLLASALKMESKNGERA